MLNVARKRGFLNDDDTNTTQSGQRSDAEGSGQSTCGGDDSSYKGGDKTLVPVYMM